MCFCEGQGPAVSGPPATAQRPGPGQDPSITARLMNTFGPSATALLNASGKNFLQAVPSSVPGATPPSKRPDTASRPGCQRCGRHCGCPGPCPRKRGTRAGHKHWR